MVVVGVLLLGFYLLLAAGGYLLLSALVRGATRVDLLWTAGFVVLFTVTFGLSSYRFGTARLLATLDATELQPEQAPELHRRVATYADRLGVDSPAVAVARMEMPNALAIGGVLGPATVVLDGRLFRLLDGPELEAIVAHELAHLETHDGLVQTLAFSLVRTVVGFVALAVLPLSLLLRGFSRGSAWIRGDPLGAGSRPGVADHLRVLVARAVMAVLFVLTLAVRAHSRRREFRADRRAAELTGRPVALARALRKIERASRPASGLLATLYVHAEEEDPLTRLLSTHPPMDERVERLVRLAEERGQAERPFHVEVR
jgi:heat shock protein HtpX